MTGYPSKRSVHTEQQMRGYTGSAKPVEADPSDEMAGGPGGPRGNDLAKPLERKHPRAIMQVDHHGVTWAYDNERGVWRNLTTGLTQQRPPPS